MLKQNLISTYLMIHTGDNSVKPQVTVASSFQFASSFNIEAEVVCIQTMLHVACDS